MIEVDQANEVASKLSDLGALVLIANKLERLIKAINDHKEMIQRISDDTCVVAGCDRPEHQ